MTVLQQVGGRHFRPLVCAKNLVFAERVPIVQRPRTRPFSRRNTGSNPVGDATYCGVGRAIGCLHGCPRPLIRRTVRVRRPRRELQPARTRAFSILLSALTRYSPPNLQLRSRVGHFGSPHHPVLPSNQSRSAQRVRFVLRDPGESGRCDAFSTINRRVMSASPTT